MKLKDRRTSPRHVLLLALLILLPIGPAAAAAGRSGILSGRVLDPDGKPVAEVKIVLSSIDGLFREVTKSTADGSFALNGIPPGEYSLLSERPGFAPSSQQGLIFEPGRTLFVRIILVPLETSTGPAPLPLWLDFSDVSTRTLIDAFQVQSLPSANNVWSLIEGQDFSATTNRIDVGGVWASLPALWSSRGSVSWTQSSYLINGMDATDPYNTGTPLYHPDIEALSFVVHNNGRFPIANISPGGAFDFIPKEGTAAYHGSVSAFFTAPGMTSGGVPSRLQEEGIFERTKLSFFGNASAQLSGPVIPEKLHVFTSLSHLNLRRDIAEFSPEDKGTVSSALVNLTSRLGRGSSIHLFWTGQIVRHPTAGAARDVPFSATLNQKNIFNVFQLIWRLRLRPNHHLELGAAFNQGRSRSEFQDGVDEPHGEEVFERIPSGAAAMADEADRSSFILQGTGQALLGGTRVRQRIDYGFSMRRAASSTNTEILDNIHLHSLGDTPFEIVRFNTPLRHKERSLDIHLFAEDTISLPSQASLSFGLHLISTRGWVPVTASSVVPGFPGRDAGGKIDWLHLSPRLGFALPLLQDRSLTLRVSAGRYFFHLPLSYLTFENPQGLGGLTYPWTDRNEDGRVQSDETGPLGRREGPYFTRIDPDLKRPYTDEFAVSFTKIFRKNLYLTLAGFYRETRHLVETLNIGVPLSAYDPVEIYDPGDDSIPGNHDDLYLTVYDQRKETLGQDFFLLTNPDAGSRVNRYRGLDLTLVKKFSRGSVFFFSATATEATGTSSPGNTEYENDDGVIGALYDDPNTFLFSKGRLRFDRAYTARLGWSVPIPYGFRLSGLVKYYDGQPFSRKIIITGFNQGPFYVQAFSRGVARYEFNMTVDLRLEKSIALGEARGRVFLDIYNVFNWAMATQENEWTGPDFTLRYATEIQSPRVVRLGIRYEF
ncbi:MAG: carboxypeptidase regulatory-like domain-containing protein [Candidatus Aminicenantales bacterium]